MDADEARTQLETVTASRAAVRTETSRIPIWYALALAVGLALLFALYDLHLPGVVSLGIVVLHVIATAVLCRVAIRRSWAEFAFVRDTLKLSDSALSKQVSTLSDAGYVEVRKTGAGRLRRTTLQLTTVGRAAFERHVAALQALLAATTAVPETTG